MDERHSSRSEFSPTAEEVAYATRVVQAHDEAIEAGCGSLALDGRMIDAPIALRARRLIARCGRGFQLTAARRSSVNLDLAGRAWAEAVVEEELALLCERVLKRLTRLELRVEKALEELSSTVHVDVARSVEERERGSERDAQMRMHQCLYTRVLGDSVC